ncbi:hypothetical protein M5689_012248 [Euphorbia peplus]|nr:hypothetical protein M5689_012246 [Euphorbia peplus]WCJ30706.1 hypothetical protein M5689_012248 [Euphorbia peplus]
MAHQQRIQVRIWFSVAGAVGVTGLTRRVAGASSVPGRTSVAGVSVAGASSVPGRTSVAGVSVAGAIRVVIVAAIALKVDIYI